MKRIDIYTDGGCHGNGSKDSVGAWAIVITNGDKVKELVGGELQTTNNRMELTAVIEAIKWFKENVIHKEEFALRIFSDSSYVVNAINKRWIKKWKLSGWLTSKKTAVANRDLWEVLNELDKEIDFQIIFVKGHDGNVHNERCDKLATEKIKQLEECEG